MLLSYRDFFYKENEGRVYVILVLGKECLLLVFLFYKKLKECGQSLKQCGWSIYFEKGVIKFFVVKGFRKII